MNIIRIGRTYPGKYLLPLLILFSLFSFIAGILHFLPFQEKNNNLFSHMNYKVRKILDKSIKERSKIEAMLNAKGGEHIVIVKYGPLHNVHAEWVYNAADIASSPIIWARDMGAKRNSELISYFPGRQYWITEISNDHKEVKIKPYKAKF